jgi:hypothetical protein
MASEPLKNLKYSIDGQEHTGSHVGVRKAVATVFVLIAAVLSAFTMAAIVAPQRASAQPTATTATMTMSVLSTTKRGVTTAGPAENMPAGSFAYSRVPTETELRTAPSGTPTVSGRVMLTVTSPDEAVERLRWFDGDNLETPPVWVPALGSNTVVVDTSVMPNGLNWIDLNGQGSGFNIGNAGTLFAFNVFNQFPLEYRLKSSSGASRSADRVAWRADEALVLESSAVPLSVFTPTFQSVTVNATTVPVVEAPATVVACGSGTHLNLALSTACGPFEVNGVARPLAEQAALQVNFEQPGVWITHSDPNSGLTASVHTPSLRISITLQNQFDYATVTYEELTLNRSGQYEGSGKQEPLASATIRGAVLLRGAIDPRFGAGTGISLTDINVNHSDIRPFTGVGTMIAMTQSKPVARSSNVGLNPRSQTTFLDTTFLANGANELIVQGRLRSNFTLRFSFPFDVNNGTSARELQLVRFGVASPADWKQRSTADVLRLSDDTGIVASDYEPLTWRSNLFPAPGWVITNSPLNSFDCRPTANTSEVALGYGCAVSTTAPLAKFSAIAGEFVLGRILVETGGQKVQFDSFRSYHFLY